MTASGAAPEWVQRDLALVTSGLYADGQTARANTIERCLTALAAAAVPDPQPDPGPRVLDDVAQRLWDAAKNGNVDTFDEVIEQMAAWPPAPAEHAVVDLQAVTEAIPILRDHAEVERWRDGAHGWTVIQELERAQRAGASRAAAAHPPAICVHCGQSELTLDPCHINGISTGRLHSFAPPAAGGAEAAPADRPALDEATLMKRAMPAARRAHKPPWTTDPLTAAVRAAFVAVGVLPEKAEE